jgi:Tol biopolymer transport system component
MIERHQPSSAHSRRGAAALLVVATVIMGDASVALAAFARLTDQTDASCQIASPSPNADASLVAFESTCDLVGTNADKNREIFQVTRAGLVSQLTNTAGCANANPASNASGVFVAFDSDCDFGWNADRNVEIVLAQAGVIVQVTNTANCDSLNPTINAAGNRIAFDSDCDITGGNVDGSVEIFRWTPGGTTVQLTDDRSVSGCASLRAVSDSSGTVVTFESDCNLSGTNGDQVTEIFQVRNAGVPTQVTMSFDEPCVNSTPAVTADGSRVAYSSDCDPTGLNPDNGVEVFATLVGAATPEQLTLDSGASDCESVEPSIYTSSTGSTGVVYTGSCDPTGDNEDASYELFLASGGSVSQLTSATGCWSVSPKTSPDGGSVVFVSTCDLDGLGGQGRAQLYEGAMCVCGSPVTRSEPTATDALYALQSAVGTKSCAPCDCDVSGDGLVSASDALRILNRAIGLPVSFDCP